MTFISELNNVDDEDTMESAGMNAVEIGNSGGMNTLSVKSKQKEEKKGSSKRSNEVGG